MVIVVAVVISVISGGLASAWAVGLGFSAAGSAAVGAAVGSFWASFAGSLLSGKSLGNSLRGALRAGITSSITVFAFTKALEIASNALNPAREAKLYKVDGQTLEVTPVDPSEIRNGSLKGKVFVNGMNNDLTDAVKNGGLRAGPGKDFYLAHNPTNGALKDLLECGLDKLAGQSDISRSTANIFAKFNPSETTIMAHSQGTMIATNALNILAKGQNVAGFTMLSWGAAQNEIGAHFALDTRGINVGRFVNHPFDPVANLIGQNAFTKPNLYRFLGSTLAFPLVFQNTEISPHSLPGGGQYLSWTPWWYDMPN